MWESIFTVMFAMGVVGALKGYTNRDNQTEPPGVEKGTPVREWPKSISPAEALGHQVARKWKVYLGGGLALIVVGLAGTAVSVVNDITSELSRDEPSRDGLIEAMSADPTNTLDRGEAVCMVDLMEAAGFDVATGPEDDFFADTGTLVAGMSEAELDEYYACFDAETNAFFDQQASEMSDERIREFFIAALVADPVDPLQPSTAECFLDVIERRGVLRDLMTEDEQWTPELEAALVEADTTCP